MKYFLLLLPVFLYNLAVSQTSELHQLSLGTGYSKAVYYNLSDKKSVEVGHDTWDLMFTAFGQTDAGIFINEGSESSFTAPKPELEAFVLSKGTKFSDLVVQDSLTNRIYNDEKNWAYGALNNTRVATNPLDYGWGTYQPASFSVVGERIFAFKLRTGNYIKFMVTSLGASGYSVKYAALDGSNEQNITIDKRVVASKKAAYLNLTTGKLVDVSPEKWDFLFTRYRYPTPDPATGNILQYNVTGTLTGFNSKVAKAKGVAVEQASWNVYKDSLQSDISVIGSEWKVLKSITTGAFEIVPDLSYFYVSPDGKVYHILFLDFAGSITGDITFESTLLPVSVSAKDILNGVSMAVVPNPVSNTQAQLILNNTQELGGATLRVTDFNGRMVYQENIQLQQGLQTHTLEAASWAPGTYHVQVISKRGLVTQKVVIQ